jgi:tight adherence protein B
MSMTNLLIIILLLLIACAAITLRLDSRRRRMERQVTISLPTSVERDRRSLRRRQTESKWQSLYRLFGYQSGIVYLLRAELVFLVGVAIAIGISYVGISFLDLPSHLMLIGSAVVGLLVIRGLFGWQQRLFRNKLFQQIPDVVELVTSTVRAGLPIAEAFAVVAKDMREPTAGQFALVVDDLRLGAPPEESLEAIYHRTGVTEYGMFAVTLAVQMKSGGALAETLQILGETVRQRVAMAGRAKAMAGEVIFSARALTAAPFLVSGVLYTVNPGSIDMLFSDPTGRLLMAYAIASVIMGALTIRWMIKRETSI